MLDLENVNAYYGDSHILHGVSLAVKEGEVVCLLGRNGAGKTTTILTIMGYLKPRAGQIVYQGRDIATLASSSAWAATSPAGRMSASLARCVPPPTRRVAGGRCSAIPSRR